MPHTITPAEAWTASTVPADLDLASQANFDVAWQWIANRLEMAKVRALGSVTTWPRTSVPIKVGVAGSSFTGAASSIVTSGGSIFAKLNDNSVLMIKDVGPYLFSGMTITGIDCVVNAFDASNTLKVEVVYQPHDYATPANEPKSYVGMGLSKNASGSGKQRLTQLGGTHVVDKTSNDYWIVVTGGSSAGGVGNADYVYGLQLIVTDPGGLRT